MAVGFGHFLYIVGLPEGSVRTLSMLDCFENLYVAADFDLEMESFGFLVTSYGDAMRVSREGEIIWRTKRLGYDGVLVHEVSNGVVRGSGEWDPPGGWEDFELDLRSGAVLIDPEIAADRKFASMVFSSDKSPDSGSSA